MSAALVILLALAGASTGSAASAWIDLVQGRGTNVLEVARAAKRCGFRTAEPNIAHGLASYHHPEDQYGELQLRKAEATPVARRCLRQKIAFFRKRYRDLYFFPDAP